MELRTAKELIDDLSYSLATPEAQDMISLIERNNLRPVYEMLDRYLKKEEIEIVIKHFRDQVETNIELIEISVSDIPLVDSDQLYIFRVGLQVTSTTGIYDFDGTFKFCTQNGFKKLDEAQQVWKVVNK